MWEFCDEVLLAINFGVLPRSYLESPSPIISTKNIRNFHFSASQFPYLKKKPPTLKWVHTSRHTRLLATYVACIPQTSDKKGGVGGEGGVAGRGA